MIAASTNRAVCFGFIMPCLLFSNRHQVIAYSDGLHTYLGVNLIWEL